MAILTSYILLSEPGSKQPNYDWKMTDKLVTMWSKIRFDAVDVLHIAPFNAKKDGDKYIFGMGDHCTEKNPTGDYTSRFEWVVERARSMNPNIKIIAMQMHNDGDYSVLKTPCQMEDYASSVANFMKVYLDKISTTAVAGKDPIKMHIDGYDLDYECKRNS
jgi:hypothetical protein